MKALERVQAALVEARNAICALGIGDIDGGHRLNAIEKIESAAVDIAEGLEVRARERQRDEEARVIKAYREGRVTIHEQEKVIA